MSLPDGFPVAKIKAIKNGVNNDDKHKKGGTSAKIN